MLSRYIFVLAPPDPAMHISSAPPAPQAPTAGGAAAPPAPLVPTAMFQTYQVKQVKRNSLSITKGICIHT